MTEFQKRPEKVEALQTTDENLDEAAALAGGWVGEDGTLMLPLYGEGSEVPIETGWFVWHDASGPRACEPAQFLDEWAEVTDGPTTRQRVESLEARIEAVAEQAAAAERTAVEAAGAAAAAAAGATS